MARQWALSCAGGCLLFFLAGCTPSSFFLNLGMTTGPAQQHVVAGSPEAVSLMTQAALGRMGLFVKATKEGQAIRLTSSTRSGKRFSLVLDSQKTEGMEQTSIALHWEKDGDETFWMQFLTAFAGGQGGSAEAAVGTGAANPFANGR
jgi:hypothetical protein